MEDVITSLDEISEEEGKALVFLARKAIEEYLNKGIIIDLIEVPYESWKKKGASFVTLENKHTGQLRGCIGSIIPVQPLYKDVIRNAIAAATQDPRFPPVTPEELPDIRVKVSILSFPEPVPYKDPQDLLNKIEPFKDGLILKYGANQGTFLPDVWEEIPDKVQFLSHLCLKAGLPQDCWLTLPVEIYRYRTKVFSE
ncbi:MAG: AmmeMemoRadiSam system protein A [Aquificae bacterium]|nr:AmmeMemoRadiSam system protein A [Aquificota bacterium]